MLGELHSLLLSRPDGLSLQQLSRMLNVQSSAIQPMIEILVRKGRLIEIGPDGRACGECALEADCNLLAVHGKRYILATR